MDYAPIKFEGMIHLNGRYKKTALGGLDVTAVLSALANLDQRTQISS
jgi:hypothetical protein